MAVDFFRAELSKIQTRFNQTFGAMTVCNIKTRQQTILAIVGMGLLEKKINREDDKNKVRHEIKRFIRTHQTLTQLFDDIERSNYVEPTRSKETIADPQALRDRTHTA